MESLSGGKAHQTGAVNSHEIIVMPTLTMREEDKDYVISFALPSDAERIAKSMHGAGSPQAQRIMITRRVNMQEKQRAAKRLCGIED